MNGNYISIGAFDDNDDDDDKAFNCEALPCIDEAPPIAAVTGFRKRWIRIINIRQKTNMYKVQRARSAMPVPARGSLHCPPG